MNTKNATFICRANNYSEAMTFEDQLQSMKDVFEDNFQTLAVEEKSTILEQLLTLSSQNELSCTITNDPSQFPSLTTFKMLATLSHSKNSI